jgi:FtsZ-binding cell division protein ZapB
MFKKKVLDTSSHRANINFALLTSQFDWHISRMGFTGYGSFVPTEDSTFEDYYNQCKNLKKGQGTFYFPVTMSEEIFQREFAFIRRILRGRKFELPVIFDYEDIPPNKYGVYHPNAKLWNNYDKKKRTAFAKRLMKMVQDLGYFVMWYASPGYIRSKLVYSELKGFGLWMAHYSNNPCKDYPYLMWQFTSTKVLNGYSKPLDMSYAYVDFPSIMIKNNLNGFVNESIEEPNKPIAVNYEEKFNESLKEIELLEAQINALTDKNDILKDKTEELTEGMNDLIEYNEDLVGKLEDINDILEGENE